MPASIIDICNMALAHVGIGQRIEALTDEGQEAAQCDQFYDKAREATLRDFDWPFAEKTIALALTEEDPNTEWEFSYTYPVDCIRARRILTGTGNSFTPRVPFKIARGTASSVIHTNLEDAVLLYTSDEKDPGLFDGSFVVALSYRLAMFIAMPLSRRQEQARMRSQYYEEISIAQANAANEGTEIEQPDSEFIRGRE
jgi:hypothetical protein